MSDRYLNPDHARRFRRLVRELNKLREDVAAEGFDANWYLACDTLNLMDGESHDGRGELPHQERVMCSARLERSSGGDW